MGLSGPSMRFCFWLFLVAVAVVVAAVAVVVSICWASAMLRTLRSERQLAFQPRWWTQRASTAKVSLPWALQLSINVILVFVRLDIGLIGLI